MIMWGYRKIIYLFPESVFCMKIRGISEIRGHIKTDPRPPLAVLGRVERRGGHVSLTVNRVKAL